MPCIVTTVHDPIALAATCRRLGLDPPTEGTVHLDACERFGWCVRLPELYAPLVCDTLTGLIAYHRFDNAFAPYARIMHFLQRYYDVRPVLLRTSRSNRHEPVSKRRVVVAVA